MLLSYQTIADAFECDTDDPTVRDCCECGELLDRNCFGELCCPLCEPCPGCNDGGMDSLLEQQELEDHEQTDEYFGYYGDE
jgi:hypothetical protein